jgi:predicted nucleotidyltransferase
MPNPTMPDPTAPRFSMEDIVALAASIADWCPHPSIRIYLFGSRLRGDHRDDSDVDMAIEITDYGDEAACTWFGNQDIAEFREDLPKDLPAPLHVLRADDDEEQELWEKIVAANPVHQDRNVTCVILPATPPRIRAAQDAQRRSGKDAPPS